MSAVDQLTLLSRSMELCSQKPRSSAVPSRRPHPEVVSMECPISQPALKQVPVSATMAPQAELRTSYKRDVYVKRSVTVPSKYALKPRPSRGVYISTQQFNMYKNRARSACVQPANSRRNKTQQTEFSPHDALTAVPLLGGTEHTSSNSGAAGTYIPQLSVRLVNDSPDPQIIDRLVKRTAEVITPHRQQLLAEKPLFCSTVRAHSFRRHSPRVISVVSDSPTLRCGQQLSADLQIVQGIGRPEEIMKESREQDKAGRRRPVAADIQHSINVQVSGGISVHEAEQLQYELLNGSAYNSENVPTNITTGDAIQLRHRVIGIAERETNILLAKLYQSDRRVQINGVERIKQLAGTYLNQDQRHYQVCLQELQKALVQGNPRASLNCIRQIFAICMERQCSQILSLHLNQPQFHAILFNKDIKQIMLDTLRINQQSLVCQFTKITFDKLYYLLSLIYFKYEVDFKIVDHTKIEKQPQKYDQNGHFLLALSLIFTTNSRMNNQLLQYMINYMFNNLIINQSNYLLNYYVTKRMASQFSANNFSLPGDELIGDFNKQISLYDYIIENQFGYQFNKGDYCMQNEFLSYDNNSQPLWESMVATIIEQNFRDNQKDTETDAQPQCHAPTRIPDLISQYAQQSEKGAKYNTVQPPSHYIIDALSIYFQTFGPYMYTSYNMADVEENIKQFEQLQMLLFFIIQELKAYVLKHSLNNLIPTVFYGVELADPLHFLRLYHLCAQVFYILARKQVISTFLNQQNASIRDYKKTTHYRFLLNMCSDIALVNQFVLVGASGVVRVDLVENIAKETHNKYQTDANGSDYQEIRRDNGLQRLPQIYKYWFLEQQPKDAQQRHLIGLIRQFQARTIVSVKNGEIWDIVEEYLLDQQEKKNAISFVQEQQWKELCRDLIW